MHVEYKLQSQNQPTKLRCVYRGYIGCTHTLRPLLADVVELEARGDRSHTNVAINGTAIGVDTDRSRFHGIMFFNCFCGRFCYADSWSCPPRRHYMRLAFLKLIELDTEVVLQDC